MTKLKFEKTVKYQALLNLQLNAPTPAKHINSPDTYKAYLERELKVVDKALAEVKLSGLTK